MGQVQHRYGLVPFYDLAIVQPPFFLDMSKNIFQNLWGNPSSSTTTCPVLHLSPWTPRTTAFFVQDLDLLRRRRGMAPGLRCRHHGAGAAGAAPAAEGHGGGGAGRRTTGGQARTGTWAVSLWKSFPIWLVVTGTINHH